MQIHQLQLKDRSKSKKRIGRGGKRGTYSGRGIKGQKSRAGAKVRPALRDIIKKIPKKRGYKFSLRKKKIIGVNLNLIEKQFKENEEVNIQSLIEKDILKRRMRWGYQVKILGNGDISKKIIVRNCILSQKAREKIEKIGGKVL